MRRIASVVSLGAVVVLAACSQSKGTTNPTQTGELSGTYVAVIPQKNPPPEAADWNVVVPATWVGTESRLVRRRGNHNQLTIETKTSQ